MKMYRVMSKKEYDAFCSGKNQENTTNWKKKPEYFSFAKGFCFYIPEEQESMDIETIIWLKKVIIGGLYKEGYDIAVEFETVKSFKTSPLGTTWMYGMGCSYNHTEASATKYSSADCYPVKVFDMNKIIKYFKEHQHDKDFEEDVYDDDGFDYYTIYHWEKVDETQFMLPIHYRVVK